MVERDVAARNGLTMRGRFVIEERHLGFAVVNTSTAGYGETLESVEFTRDGGRVLIGSKGTHSLVVKPVFARGEATWVRERTGGDELIDAGEVSRRALEKLFFGD